MDSDNIMGCALFLFFAGIGLAVAVAIGSWLIDVRQERKAYPAIAACKAHRMEVYRKTFGSEVTCIPVNARQDTTTYNLNVKQ